MKTADELWNFLVNRQDLIRGDDGMWLYWPHGWNKGGMHETILRQLAARMLKENRQNGERLAKALHDVNRKEQTWEDDHFGATEEEVMDSMEEEIAAQVERVNFLMRAMRQQRTWIVLHRAGELSAEACLREISTDIDRCIGPMPQVKSAPLYSPTDPEDVPRT